MIVTVMSDASFCPQTKSSGYGVWVKSNRGQFQCGGNFKGKIRNPQEAEAKGLSIAVWACFYQGIAKSGDRIILQTDNMPNINAFKNGLKNKNHTAIEAIEYIKSMIKEYNCTFEIRHVKAHNPSAGNRNYINDLCDKMARDAMERQRGF